MVRRSIFRPGEVHALVGENGAGKSTLIRIVTGAQPPDSGTLISVGSRSGARVEAATSRSLGIAPIARRTALFPNLTVSENIAMSTEGRGLWERVRWRDRSASARELLGRVRRVNES